MDQMGSQDSGMGAAVVVRLPPAPRARAESEDRTVASLLRLAARAYLDVAERPVGP